MADALTTFLANHSTASLVWVMIGFAGQALFAMRFLVQWLSSEKEKRSVIPVAFWYFSIGGSLILLAYAIHIRDVVFLSGQLFGMLVYSRNLFFVFNEKKLNKANTNAA